jgi:hypothetical protein
VNLLLKLSRTGGREPLLCVSTASQKLRGVPQVSNDELGDDRPETVRAFYAKVWAWLNDSEKEPIQHAL